MNSDLWVPIQDYIGKLNTGHMPAVHHYTTLKGALGILKNGRIWFTERAHLNDPSEIAYGLEVANNFLRNRNRTSDADRLETSAARAFRNFRFFSASFSFEPDDLSQWRNYADDGKGVVLSFRASAFDGPKPYIDRFLADNASAIVCPIGYSRGCLEGVIGRIIEKWNGSDIGELCDHLFMISSMFKNGCWETEKEYRFFVHHNRETILMSDCHMTRERDGQIVSFLNVPVQNWHSAENFPIYRICVGPASPNGLEAQLNDYIFSLGIPIQVISRSNLAYRTIRRI